MKTRKIFALLTVLALLFSCAAFAEGSEYQFGSYQIYNKTGEKVVEVKITDKVTGYETLYGGDEMNYLLDGEMTKLEVAIPAGEDGEHRLSLYFKTESGREGTFDTLSIEDVSIELLAADAMTGATPIAFGKPEESKEGVYTIYNRTGETILFLNLIENVEKGEDPLVLRQIFTDGFAPNTEKTLSIGIAADKADTTTLTLQFVTESGKIGIFSTLKIEEAPITLLDVDSVSGATPISFSVPEPVLTNN